MIDYPAIEGSADEDILVSLFQQAMLAHLFGPQSPVQDLTIKDARALASHASNTFMHLLKGIPGKKEEAIPATEQVHEAHPSKPEVRFLDLQGTSYDLSRAVDNLSHMRAQKRFTRQGGTSVVLEFPLDKLPAIQTWLNRMQMNHLITEELPDPYIPPKRYDAP